MFFFQKHEVVLKLDLNNKNHCSEREETTETAEPTPLFSLNS